MTKARDLASAAPAPSTVSATELGYLDGVSSAIQTQIDGKSGTAHNHDGTYATSAHNHNSDYIANTLTNTTGDIIYASGANTPARLGIGSTGNVLTVSGGIPSWAAPAGGGKVLQVVSGATTSQVDSYSTTYVDTNLTATITPTSATSKILILGQQSFWTANHGDVAGSRARIVRNSTVINQRDNFGAIEAGRTGSNIVAFNFTWGIVYLDSPNTTSATTYKTQYGNAVTPVGWASAVNPFGTPAQIILLEIGA
jgi:hypothetical protein